MNKKRLCWGLDSEGLASGKIWKPSDVWLIQVCRSDSEDSALCFHSGKEFKEWYNKFNSETRPRRFYSFTLPYEYGSMAGWELVNIDKANLQQPWLDKPVNLFYINPLNTKNGAIPVVDCRAYFGAILQDKSGNAKLEALGDEMSTEYNVDAHKYPTPSNSFFGKRKPRPGEQAKFERYAKRDAYICALAGQWIEQNIFDTWLKGTSATIENTLSWGTIAKYYLDLPQAAKVKYRNGFGKCVWDYENKWNTKILEEAIFAGRSEAFYTGNVGHPYYCDVSSLYPISLVQSQAMRIKGLQAAPQACHDKLYGKMTCGKFQAAIGKPYGWIYGTFTTADDLWGLPCRTIQRSEDEDAKNLYVRGEVTGTYHSLDLEASNAEVIDIHCVILPIHDEDENSNFYKSARKYEELLTKKLSGTATPIEEVCIKSTLNAASGKLGEHRHGITAHTNPPVYSTILAQSHVIMSDLLHKYTEGQKVYYCDTDSLFMDRPPERDLHAKWFERNLQPYPGLPYTRMGDLPLYIKVKGVSRKEGCIIFRNKLYYQSARDMDHSYSQARGGWQARPEDYKRIVEGKLHKAKVEVQVSRKWKTKTHRALKLAVGRWHTETHEWKLKKLKRYLRADLKRCRTPDDRAPDISDYDSYQLHLDDKLWPSRSWTYNEALINLAQEPARPMGFLDAGMLQPMSKYWQTWFMLEQWDDEDE